MPRELKELIAHPVQVRRRMTELGFTNRSLAEKVGCTAGVVGKLLCGISTRTLTVNADGIEKELQVQPGKYFDLPPMITDPQNQDDQGSAEAVDGDAA